MALDRPDTDYLIKRLDPTRIRCGMCGTLITIDNRNAKVKKGRNEMDFFCPTCRWNKEFLNLRYFADRGIQLPPSRSIIYNPLKF